MTIYFVSCKIKLHNILVELDNDKNITNILLHDFSRMYCVSKDNEMFKNSNMFGFSNEIKKLHLIYYKFILYLVNWIILNSQNNERNINNCLYYDYFKNL